jgi:7-cyano-7-deazaguanine synthase
MVGRGFAHLLQAPMRQHVPLPHRNLVLASLGASYAGQLEVGSVMLALNQEDLGAYSATSSPFLAATQAVFQV